MSNKLDQRNIRVEGEPDLSGTNAYYDKSWALVIGINDYSGRHPNLANARNDAVAFADMLEKKHGFQIITLLDEQATRSKIMEMLRDELPASVGRNDRVVFFFAGHGTTWSIATGSEPIKYGYLIPQDAEGSSDRPRYSQYIDMDELRRTCGIIPAKHIFIVLDCCFSGVAAVTSRAEVQLPRGLQYDAYLKSATERPAWQILTAGRYDEQAADSGLRPGHSAFTSALLDGLEGDADQNKDGLVTVGELGPYIAARVKRETSRDGARGQTPFCSYIAGSDQGDFIFLLGDRAKPKVRHLDMVPYFGLDAFEEGNAKFFFGRDRVMDDLLRRLRSAPRFLGLKGRSGGGKTSIIQAGLISRLHKGSVPGSDRWDIILAKPDDKPFENLEDKGLKGVSQGLIQAVKTWFRDHPGTERLVLILDQFEEFLVTCPKQARDDFLRQLSELLDDQSLAITIILSLRDDFLRRLLLEAPFLQKWAEKGFIDVSPDLREEELRSVIEGPAAQVGLEFEEGLVEAIIDDALAVSPGDRERESSSAVLPLLESSLTKLCDKCKDTCIVTHKDYSDIDKLSCDLQSWADRAYEKLSIDGLGPLAQQILVGLVSLGDKQQDTPDTGRRRTLESLCHDEGEIDAVHRVVQKLADARLVATSFDEKASQEIVKIIDNALIQRWEVLRQWLDNDRAFLKWRRGIENEAQDWRSASSGLGKLGDESRLLSGQRLVQAEKWLKERGGDLTKVDKSFIQASLELRGRREKAEEQSKKEKEKSDKRIRTVLIVFSIAVLILAVYAYSQKNYAVNQKTLADEKAQESLALYLASQSELISLDDEPDSFTKSVLTAIESLRHRETLQGYNSLRESMALLPPCVAIMSPDGLVQSVAFSPDGPKVATTSDDHIALIWDIKTGDVLYNLTHNDDFVVAMTFSPDCSKVATVSHDRNDPIDDYTIRIWDVKTGVELPRLHHVGPWNAVVFSLDGSKVSMASGNRTQMWDVKTGGVLYNLTHNDDSVVAMTFSPDCSKVATVSRHPNDPSNNDTVRIWDVKTGDVLHNLTYKGFVVNSVAFSPDGSKLATALQNGTAQILDLKTGEELHKLGAGYFVGYSPDPVQLVTFSPDGSKVATTSMYAGQIKARIYDAKTGINLYNQSVSVQPVTFSLDGSKVASVDYYTVRILDAQTGKELRRLIHNDSVKSVAFSSDGSKVTTISDNNIVRIWDIFKTEDRLQRLNHDGQVNSVAFSPDGSKVATASYDNTSRIWDLRTGEELHRLTHNGSVWFVSFSPDGSKVATASSDSTARIWDVQTGKELHNLTHNGSVWFVSFSPDGSKVATASFHNYSYSIARIWNVQSGADLGVLNHEDHLKAVTFSPDGSKVVTVGGESNGDINTARIWDVQTGKELHRPPDNGFWLSVAFSPDKSKMAAARGNNATIWDAQSGVELHKLNHDGLVKSVAFSPDGSKVATASNDNTVRIWDAQSGLYLDRLKHDGPVQLVTFSPDGSKVATARAIAEDTYDNTYDIARIWDVQRGVELHKLYHDGLVESITFSRNGSKLATIGWGIARIWDVQTGKELRNLTHDNFVMSVTFSPDGSKVATTSRNNVVRIWQISKDELIDDACSLITQNMTIADWKKFIENAESDCITCPKEGKFKGSRKCLPCIEG